MAELRQLQATLWQCAPGWRRQHGQRVTFEDWPKGGRVFVCRDSSGLEHRLGDVVGVEFQSGGRVVRFTSKGTRFELEKTAPV